MAKQKRTGLDVLLSSGKEIPEAEEKDATEAPKAKQQEPGKPKVVRATLYLPQAVHEQLRELAFVERTKMHSLLLEGLDRVFEDRGLKKIDQLTEER